MSTFHPPEDIVRCFCSHPDTAEITILGEGNINDTFLVRTKELSFVLQRINVKVFPDPQILINNLQHLSQHLLSLTTVTTQRWQDAMLIPALDGSSSIRDHKGGVWRALTYVDDSICFSQAETLFQAEQTGWALGHFHKRLIGLEVEKMQIPLPGFHCIGNYLEQYAQLNRESRENESPEIQSCRQTIKENRKEALELEQTISKKKYPARIIHGDPKIANILFDKKSGLATSLIDLDTVGPGLPQHDIGDCLRSVCNRGGEESRIDETSFDLTFCEASLKGYFRAARGYLVPDESELIYNGLQAITYELGLRFFMDYLQGGLYFKCKTPEDTLRKAQVQFTLLQDIIAKGNAIRQLIVQLSK